MQRGRALLMAGAVLVAARLLPATADTTPTTPPDPCTPATAPATGAPANCEMPRPACTHTLTDTTGDAVTQYIAGEGDTNKQLFGNNTALDIRSVYLRLTPDYFQTFLAIDHIPGANTMAAQEGEYRYYVNFKLGGKMVTVIGWRLNPNAPDSLNPADNPSTYPQVQVGADQAAPSANDPGDPTVSQVILPGASPDPGWVIVSTPRAELEKSLGTPIASDAAFTNIVANTYVVSPNSTGPKQFYFTDGTTETGAAAQLGAFDDSCFGPPPTSLGALSIPATTYHHVAALSATLLDQDAKPIAGKAVTFTVADGKSTTLPATTDANGVARANYGPVAVPAGNYPVTVAFAGDTTTYKHSSATGTLKVVAAKSQFTALKVTKPTASTRLVATTLLDDLKKPIAGARVDWYVNGKKAASSTTDKTGKATFKAGKPGQTVQARYAGKAGMFLASASKSAKL